MEPNYIQVAKGYMVKEPIMKGHFMCDIEVSPLTGFTVPLTQFSALRGLTFMGTLGRKG